MIKYACFQANCVMIVLVMMRPLPDNLTTEFFPLSVSTCIYVGNRDYLMLSNIFRKWFYLKNCLPGVLTDFYYTRLLQRMFLAVFALGLGF